MSLASHQQVQDVAQMFENLVGRGWDQSLLEVERS